MELSIYKKIDDKIWGFYKEDCLKTESLINPLNEDVEKLGIDGSILHCVMGVATEIDEFNLAMKNFDRVNALEELGDILWYLAILDIKLEYFGKYVVISEFNAEALDACKKTLFYGKELDLHRVKKSLSSILSEVIYNIDLLGSTPYKVMETNINKLKARYPDKFTSRKAEVRDLDKERQILEDGLN